MAVALVALAIVLVLLMGQVWWVLRLEATHAQRVNKLVEANTKLFDEVILLSQERIQAREEPP